MDSYSLRHNFSAALRGILQFRVWLFILLIFSLSMAGPVMAAKIQKFTATVAPVRSDSFSLTLKLEPSEMDSQDISIALERFQYSIPYSEFVSSKGGKELVYKTKGPGIAKATLKVKSRLLKIEGSALALSGLPNPLPITVAIGSASSCEMLSLKQTIKGGKKQQERKKTTSAAAKRKTTVYTRKASSQCVISEAHVVEPGAIIAGQESSVKVEASIVDGAAATPLNLYRANTNGKATGAALCSLEDGGNGILQDRTYGCSFNIKQAQAASITLVVSGSGGAVSPGFSLPVVPAFDESSAEETVSLMASASSIAQSKIASLGDTGAAGVAIIQELRKMNGINDAVLASNGLDIAVEYESGLLGIIVLSRREASSQTAAQMSSGVEAPEEIVSTAQEVGNSSVLIWDPGYFGSWDSEADTIAGLFGRSQEPVFSVTSLRNQNATFEALQNITGYGTVVLVTHGFMDRNSLIGLQTKQEITRETLLAYKDDFQARRLVGASNPDGAPQGYIGVMPGYISKLPGSFQNTVVWAGFCHSAQNTSMSRAFLGKGASSYFGFTRQVSATYAKKSAIQLFCNLLLEGDDTSAAFGKVTPKLDDSMRRPWSGPDRDPDHGLARFVFEGGLGVSYPLVQALIVAIDPKHAQLIPDRRVTLQADIGSKDQLPCADYKWSNTNVAGSLENESKDNKKSYHASANALDGQSDEVTLEMITKYSERSLGTAKAQMEIICAGPPVPDISLPTSPSQIDSGDSVNLSASVTLPEGCNLKVEWTKSAYPDCGSITVDPANSYNAVLSSSGCPGGQNVVVTATLYAEDTEGIKTKLTSATYTVFVRPPPQERTGTAEIFLTNDYTRPNYSGLRFSATAVMRWEPFPNTDSFTHYCIEIDTHGTGQGAGVYVPPPPPAETDYVQPTSFYWDVPELQALMGGKSLYHIYTFVNFASDGSSCWNPPSVSNPCDKASQQAYLSANFGTWTYKVRLKPSGGNCRS